MTVLIACGIYGSYNFSTDREKALEIMMLASNGNVKQALEEMNKVEGFVNPLINFKYQGFKSGFHARFVTRTETIENNFGNNIMFDIANIYREYWRKELLKPDSEKMDSILYKNLTTYIVKKNLSKFNKDSLEYNLRNDKELTRIINKQGFKCKFFFLNGMQDLIIWKKERREKSKIEIPTGVVNVTVVHLDDVLLSGYSGYASFDLITTGGWAEKETPTIYCLSSSYDIDSEKYKISYLKHESIHFSDLNKYPNLSSADLEYRAKLTELIYCTKESIYDRIAEFLNGASPADRNYSHPFADHCIIQNFSQIIFQNNYENDYTKWLEIDVKTLNETALKLFKSSEEELSKDTEAIEVIQRSK